jgi:hypothetical protein
MLDTSEELRADYIFRLVLHTDACASSCGVFVPHVLIHPEAYKQNGTRRVRVVDIHKKSRSGDTAISIKLLTRRSLDPRHTGPRPRRPDYARKKSQASVSSHRLPYPNSQTPRSMVRKEKENRNTK